MEIRHLRYFVAVAEELHFSRAAAKLNISTPTLSEQIRSLEASLGTQLFTRKTRSVALTYVGKSFLEEARATIKQVERIELFGRRAARGDVGSVLIGYVLAEACSGRVASSVCEFMKLHPDVSFQPRRMETFPQMKALIEGTVDVGFIRSPKSYPTELSGFVIDRHELWLAMPDAHRFASLKAVEPEMLADEPFVTVSVEIEVGSGADLSTVTLLGLSVRIATRVRDLISVLNCVAAGMGLGVVPEPVTRIPIPGLVYRRIGGMRRYGEFAVAFRKNEATPVVTEFIKFLRTKSRRLSSRVASMEPTTEAGT